MPREKTAFARKIIDFYAEKGVECSVVDEHLSLLVTLSAEGGTHEFRYGGRAFGADRHTKKFYQVLDKEWSRLKAAAAGNDLGPEHRRGEAAAEEARLPVR
ncbi:MAG: hypothetical protein HY550_04075 [Elusimicrobia bacterium]|nr:hypothetical protein [Elusimicrobiota bacterium]